MTLVESQRNKMNAIVSDFVSKEMVPALYKLMKEKKTGDVSLCRIDW